MLNAQSLKQVVLVVGMHRSGTSCVARALQSLGISLGDRLMAAAVDNPKGFWEDTTMVDINNQLLASLQLSWDSFAAALPTQLIDHPLVSAAIGSLNAHFQSSTHYGFKDPRASRLLFFWQKVFSIVGASDSYVIVVRNPLNVAYSLHARDGFNIEKSLLLWLQHLVPAVNMTHGKKRIFVDYDLVLGSPATELQRMALSLGLTDWQGRAAEDFTREFLDTGLNHHVADCNALRQYQQIGLLALEAYHWLSQLARDEIDFNCRYLLERWQAITEQLAPFEKICHYLDGLNRQLDAKHQQIQTLQHELRLASSLRVHFRRKGKALYKKMFRKK